jgi:hypothetical protein
LSILVGPSTGWFNGAGINDPADQYRLSLESGANAIEFCMGGWAGDDRMLKLQQAEPMTGMEFRSLHLPDFGETLPEGAVELVKALVERHNIDAALTHPLLVNGEYPIELHRAMVDGGVPLAIENMDSRKDSGFFTDDLGRLLEIGDLAFVLDVQHAYEHDPTMGWAWTYFNKFGHRISHFHVSGSITSVKCRDGEDIHARLCVAENAQPIIAFLQGALEKRNLPLIIEGRYDNFAELAVEIQFLRNHLEQR